MKYWIIINDVQIGPKTIEELREQPGLSLSTPIWYEGLPDWTTVAMVPEIASWFNAPIDPYASASRQGMPGQPNQPYGQPYGQQSYQQAYNQQSYQPYNAYQQPNQQPGQPPMPKNYLVWAIIVTICCCIVTGVIAIVYSSKVSPAYYRGDYIEAEKASEKASLWVIISFVLGLIIQPFYTLVSLMSM